VDVGSLGAQAGNALVAAAVTDAWGAARRGFACLFGRGKPDPRAEKRLDATRRRIAAATPAELEQVRTGLVREWALRVGDLLEDNPDAEAEVRSVVEEIQALLPADIVLAADHSIAARGDVTITGDRGGFAAGVFHEGGIPPGPTWPGPVSA
jgi:hypothetical protein